MKNFLAVYTGSKDSANAKKWNALDEKTRNELTQKGGKAWMAWAEKNKNAIVTIGGPLSKTKRVDAKGITDISNQMSAFTVVQAESQEAAARLFLEHPHFTIFPGDGVEIMEVMPIPKM